MLTEQAAVAQRADFRALLPLSLDRASIKAAPLVAESKSGSWPYKKIWINGRDRLQIGSIEFSGSAHIGVPDLTAAQALAEHVVLAVNSFDALVEYFNASQLMVAAQLCSRPPGAAFDEAVARNNAAMKGVMLALAGRVESIGDAA